MQHIQTLLKELDQLSNTDSLEAYEMKWESAVKQIEQELPGFTIAYAELYNSGTARMSDGSMHHVIVPKYNIRNAEAD